MNGREFLNTARRLVPESREAPPPDVPEEDLRTAASRAYYALFLTARDVLDPDGTLFPSDRRVHGAVRRLLNEYWQRNRRSRGPVRATWNALGYLYDWRTEGDYLRPRKLRWSVSAVQDCIRRADAQVSNILNWGERQVAELQQLYPRLPSPRTFS